MKKIYLIILLSLLFKLSRAQQNTILIIADDVGTDYFGFYEDARDTAIAPNIRTLLSKGIRFSKAWASPVCSPTRAGIFTGRYPFRTGVGGVITNNMSPQIDTSEMSIAKLLKYYAPVKYNTANVGKWHLHNQAPPKLLYPNLMGYDFYSGNFNGAIPDYYNYARVTNGIVDTVTTYATTQTINDAIGWLDTVNGSNPFFLWLAFNAPHSPYHLPPTNLITNTGLTGTAIHIAQNPELYFKAAIEAMDTEIGRLFQYLVTTSRMDSTNIIFIGDNGNAQNVAQVTPNHAKQTLYDYGVHVPFIIAGPAVVNPDRVSDALVSTPDLIATIVELAGFSNWINFIPPNKLPIDSRSILPIIKNQATFIRDWNFTEQFASPALANDGKTIRNLDYQLIRLDNGTEEMYNMLVDTFQQNNLLSGTLTSIETMNYYSLCDTLSSLIGINSCNTTIDLTENFVNDNFLFTVSNPFTDHLIIQPKVDFKKASLSLYDIRGRLIEEWSNLNFSGSEYVKLKINKKIGAGIYILNLKTSSQNITLKMCHP